MRDPHYVDDLVTVYHGDCLEVLAELPDASVDAVVTDPPYGLGFMGKAWDADFEPGDSPMRRSAQLDAVNAGAARQGGRQRASADYQRRMARDSRAFGEWCESWARECLRVLKPGGHLLAFGGTRTSHRLTAGVEDAGCEIRDSIAWLYGQGFPKSRNLDGEWTGWGTALKPAHEPIVVARKPLAGTVTANVLAHGTGALNVDGCRTGTTGGRRRGAEVPTAGDVYSGPTDYPKPADPIEGLGRWPTNVVLDETQADELDRQTGILRESPSREPVMRNRTTTHGHLYGGGRGIPNAGVEVFGYADTGGAPRFFPVFRYEAKAPTAERPRDGHVAHPTIKPLDLMRWLVRLVTPPSGVVLDPFAGSGTTAEACVIEGFRCIAIEREAEYLGLITQRLTKPIAPVLDLGEWSA